jgi:hypothetical protein
MKIGSRGLDRYCADNVIDGLFGMTLQVFSQTEEVPFR